MLRNNARQLLKHTSIYSLSWFASAASGILLLPVYTRYLSVADYGSVDLVNQINMILRIVFIAGFTYSVGRFFYDATSERERKLTLSTSAMNIIIVAAIACLASLLLRYQICDLILGDAKHVSLIVVGVCIMFFDMAYAGLSYQYLVRKQSLRFVKLNLIKLAVAICANLVCVVWLRMGAIGMLIGNLTSYIPVCIIAFASLARTSGLRIDWKMTKSMFLFGCPMIPAGLLATVLHNADRLLLRPLGSLEQVGIFTMGLQFPGMLNAVLLTSFGSIWGGSVMFQISQQQDRDYQTGKIATYCMTVFLVLQTVLGIFAGTILLLLADPKFAAAAEIIPVVCLGYGFHAFYMFMVSKAFTDGNPRRMIPAYAIPVVFKCCLTFALVPRFGYMASAWIMTASYAVFIATCYLLFRRVNTAKFEFGRISFLFAYCSLALVVSNAISFEFESINFAARALLIIVLGIGLWCLPVFNSSEKQSLLEEARVGLERIRRNRTGAKSPN